MQSDFLDGKVAIVTGGGRGLGRAMARGLARAGARVVLTAARKGDEMQAAVEEIARETAADRVFGVLSDVGQEQACREVVAAAVTKFGRLDIVVNNAARGMRFVTDSYRTQPPRFWDVPVETFQMAVAANVGGPFYMARAATPLLLKAGWGRIINITVNRQTINRKGFTPYGVSKAALEAETAIWAQDLAGSGVTVNALLPGGATLTGMIPESEPEDVRAGLLSPEIIVPPLLWLASSAADGINGKRVSATAWTPNDPHLEDAGY
jgi:NAD(P)-dependent dehydrogenase (short-subunit alcohol dehydrogenase family)